MFRRANRIAKKARTEVAPVLAKQPDPPPTFDLRAIADRARLSLECYRYTGNRYWLTCAGEDCRKGRLDWKELCKQALGAPIPMPKSTDD